ncbi:MAG: FxsA family protein [Pseudomonadales bacterium]
MRFLFLLFIAVPIVEMFVLIKVGGIIGALPTIGLVVLTAVLGIWLLRLEGLATLARVQEKLDRGELPETELLEGVMLLIGGALLLTPGFVTDAMGFICLLPGLRRPLARWIMRRGVVSAIRMHTAGGRGRDDNGGPGGNRTIEGEFVDVDDDGRK